MWENINYSYKSNIQNWVNSKCLPTIYPWQKVENIHQIPSICSEGESKTYAWSKKKTKTKLKNPAGICLDKMLHTIRWKSTVLLFFFPLKQTYSSYCWEQHVSVRESEDRHTGCKIPACNNKINHSTPTLHHCSKCVCVLSYSHIFGMIMILRNKKKVLLWPFHCSHYLYYYCYPTINFLGTVVMVIKQSLNWGGIERDGESLSKGKWDRVKGRLSAIFGPYFHDHNKMLNEGIRLWCCIFMAFLSPLVESVTWWTTT